MPMRWTLIPLLALTESQALGTSENITGMRTNETSKVVSEFTSTGKGLDASERAK